MRKTSTTESESQGSSAAQGSSKAINIVKAQETFIEKALPLHVNLTHSPPKLLEDDKSDSIDDPGHIGTLTLVPCTFTDGSHGWKGRRRANVELLNVRPGEKAPMVDIELFVSAKAVNDQGVATSVSTHAGEADGGAGGYESDNDDSSLMP